MSKFLLLLLTISPIAIKAFGQGTDALADSTIKFAEQKLSYLNEQFASVASNVWDVQTSDREIIAAARTWFHAQDRMHQ